MPSSKPSRFPALLIPIMLVASASDASKPTSASPAEKAADHNVVVASLLRPHQVSLNGAWYFREDPDDAGERDGWFRPGNVRGRTALVPLPWQLALPALREYLGTAWYEREFQVPASA